MADSKISALTAATTLADTDELVIASSGASKKITGDLVKVPYAPLIPSGLWTQIVVSNNATITLTLNEEMMFGVVLGKQTLTGLAVRVTQAGDASAVVRLGIREDSAGEPATPAVDQTVVATSTGWQSAAFTYAHPGGTLWISVTGQGWSVTPVKLDGGGSPGLPFVTANALSTLGWAAGHRVTAGAQESVSGALPGTFTNTRSSTLDLSTVALQAA